MRFPLSSRSDPEALGSLPLTSSSGAQVPLSQVATIKQQNGESTITRENNHRNLTVRIDLAGRDMVSYLAEVKARIAQSVQFDQSKYHLEYGGQFENQQRAQARLTLILGLVLGLMVLLLFTEFGKLRQALLILGIVPLAAFGGLIALFVRGETFNVAIGGGVHRTVRRRGAERHHHGGKPQPGARDRRLAVARRQLRGASERFRPVLTTATVATIGMMPAALATGVGSDVQRGVATVVVGGLILATLLTLFILPTFYFVIERRVERWDAARSQQVAE